MYTIIVVLIIILIGINLIWKREENKDGRK